MRATIKEKDMSLPKLTKKDVGRSYRFENNFGGATKGVVQEQDFDSDGSILLHHGKNGRCPYTNDWIEKFEFTS